ncbi:hypothetical protein [Candidatus Regiella insecticola]|uniref:Uncharacterized protein n=1 Tax=Candidatus Regiella insecticola TaxID=138073 RepID=A0A6L2ZNA7_9ENTR|nr:hypothetical protein [Candidatus Regiella insecticola]GFN45558.1 hypothetical protein RINTU1_07760 [Candidatus Regiella insecticola]GFN45731.1 hypothetical protein RINTU1_10150 [Candidatus Regiella insecticola]
MSVAYHEGEGDIENRATQDQRHAVGFERSLINGGKIRITDRFSYHRKAALNTLFYKAQYNIFKETGALASFLNQLINRSSNLFFSFFWASNILYLKLRFIALLRLLLMMTLSCLG